MPALHLLGRAWRVGSDDFVYPGLTDLVVSSFWLAVSTLVYWKNGGFTDCSGSEDILIYMIGIFVIMNLKILTSIALIHNSKAGTVTDTKARRFVPLCIYIRCFIEAILFSWNILGTVWVFNGSLSCPSSPEIIYLVMGFVISNWGIILGDIFVAYYVFDPFGSLSLKDLANENRVSQPPQDGVDFSQLRTGVRTQIWTSRFKRYFFSSAWRTKSESWALHEAAVLFSSSLANTNLVLSDVISGIVLLILKNRNAHVEETLLQRTLPANEKAGATAKEPSRILTPYEQMQQDWRHRSLLARFHIFAMAAYHLPVIVCDPNPINLRQLRNKFFCCGCLPGRKHPLNVVGDGCCFYRTAGVRYTAELAGVEDDDFIYLNFSNTVCETPFFVAKDTATKTIVVSIRGSMSIDDAITDLAGWPSPIGPEFPENFKAHDGMIKCARLLQEKLEVLNILPQVLDENPGYTLVFTGTSLGAGVSSILSTYLRRQYPDVKTYAFAPPGGLMSEELAEYTNDYIQSVIYGNDFITRLSIRSVEKAKYAIMDVLKESKTPKYLIVLQFWLIVFGLQNLCEYLSQEPSHKNTRSTSRTQLWPRDSVRSEDSSDVKVQIEDTDYTNGNNPVSGEKRLWLPCGEMYPPGKIIYVTRNTNSFGSQSWRMRWASRFEFHEIIFHPRMGKNHFPFGLQRALLSLNESKAEVGMLPSCKRRDRKVSSV